ncbi:hypothetical protein ICW40_04075 [Actinotalea ferrariae]|uniref:hypothetical protein n=1 Tax=Actinotalea ferrariae TaxID=1386098 RepID=UPI001C8C1985|nr:hypothetical protein [Actinotalea ferrariae]MBX9243984.1 hypothetical protein [Actinotalea ferrariae]
MARQRVLVDMLIAAAPDDVWTALRDPEVVGRWFGWDYEGLDAEIRLIFGDAVTADDAARTLSWPDGDRFELEAEGDGTRLRVARTHHDEFDGAYDPVDEGWITFAQQLRFALERHPGQERRTVSVHGLGLGPHEAPLLSELGLRMLGDDPVGNAYEVQRADGSTFTGEVFFQTDLQIGLTVADEGDALLVVARTPPSAAPPDGEVMLVLSVYDVDEERLAEVERRWTAWWSGPEEADHADGADASEGASAGTGDASRH